MRRLVVGVVGCLGVDKRAARKFALGYCKELPEGVRLVTIRQDVLGRAVRLRAKSLDIRRKTVSTESHEPYADWSAMTVATLIWKCTEVLVLHDGSSGFSREAIDICTRMRKPMKIVNV